MAHGLASSGSEAKMTVYLGRSVVMQLMETLLILMGCVWIGGGWILFSCLVSNKAEAMGLERWLNG